MEELFQSAFFMEKASNYNNWSFEQSAPYVKGKVLEVGCGVGGFTQMLATHKNTKSLLAIDINPEAVSYTREKLKHVRNAEIRHQDIYELDEKFDLIVCQNVLEHVQDDGIFLEKLIDLLHADGSLFLLVPSHQQLYCAFDKEAGHYRRYDKRSLNSLVKHHKAKVVDQYYFNPIGALGYFFVYKILRKRPLSSIENELGFFDRFVVPFAKGFLPKASPFGISLISVFKKSVS